DGEVGSQANTYEPLTNTIASHDAVAPLIKTRWDQHAPYNGRCPILGVKTCSTGCVATAMAQILNYHKYPADLPALDAYKTKTQGIMMPALPEIPNFAWNSLKNTYEEDDTDENIAALMLYCGQSVDMDYGQSGTTSGADDDNVPYALRNYFGYKSASIVERSRYTTKKWDELIYNELANGRPVYYRGASSNGGHAFVCDGYDGYGYYHINWGWGGFRDDYFLLSALNPDGVATGAIATLDEFNFVQQAVVNIMPTEETRGVIKLGVHHFRYDDVNEKFLVNYINKTGFTYTFDFGIGCIKDNGKIELIGKALKTNDPFVKDDSYTQPLNVPLTHFSGLPTGTYKVVPISKLSNAEEWQNCYDNDEYYAVVSVNDGHVNSVEMHPIEDYTASLDNTERTMFVNTENKISVTFTNNSCDTLEKHLRLCYIAPDANVYVKQSYADISVAAGKTETVQFVFKPDKGTGNYTLQVRDFLDYNTLFLNEEVTVVSLPSGEYKTSVSNPRFVGGASPRLEFEIKNEDSFDHPVRNAKIGLYYDYKDDGSAMYTDSIKFYVDRIPAGKTITASCDVSEKFKYSWTKFSISSEYGGNSNLSLYNEGLKTWDNHDISGTPEATFYTAQPSGFGYTSFAKDVALDFSECEDLTAYTGTLKEDGGKQVLQMKEQTQVPANTGLVLKGKPYVRYAVRMIDSAPAIPDNDLVAVTSDEPVAANSILVLGCIDREVGFYNYTATSIAAGHSCLLKSKTGDVSKVEMVWDAPSGINSVQTEYDTVPTATFNIAGQRVDERYKGIVIKNGKKLIAK
ncbi:MAG: C10 family peptidase, partial [Bacteroidaceae bacterium]|nr:C10 family peptidase [Bacteroidaceae bacterium]